MKVWRIFACFVLVATAACGLSLPRAYIPRNPTAQDWPDVGAAVLEDVATLEYRVMSLPQARGPRLVAVLDHRRRIKVLQPSGLSAADVELPVDGYSTITRVVARSVSADMSESSMSQSALKIVGRSGSNERSPDVAVMQFHIPDGSVGGLLEYRYQRIYVDPYLVEPWIFGGDTMPVVSSEFGLVVTPEVKADYRFGYGDKMVDRAPLRRKSDNGDERLVFIEKDLPALYKEPMRPDVSHIAPWIAVSLRSEKLDDIAQRLDTWDDVGRTTFERMLQVKGHAGKGPVAERYKSLRQHLTPLILPGLGVRTPQDGEALLEGSPACSRDATALLMQALVGADVQASPALLVGPSGPQALADFPAFYPFTQVVGAVQVTASLLKEQNCGLEPTKQGPLCGTPVGGYVFADPLCRTCDFGSLPPRLSGGRALLIGPQEAQWVDVPLDLPQHNSLKTTIKFTMEVDGALDGSMEAEARGTRAMGLRQLLLDSEDDPMAILRKELIGSGRGPTISGVKFSDPNQVDVPLQMHARIAAKAEQQDYEHFRMRAADLAGISIPDVWRGTRHTAALLDGPRWFETTAEVVLPVGYEVEQRQPIRLSNNILEYAGGFVLRGRTLRFSRRLVLKIHAIDQEGWNNLQEIIAQIRDFEQDGPRVWSAD